METTWKDRMWHLFLVCVLGVVVSTGISTGSKLDTVYSPVATAYAQQAAVGTYQIVCGGHLNRKCMIYDTRNGAVFRKFDPVR